MAGKPQSSSSLPNSFVTPPKKAFCQQLSESLPTGPTPVDAFLTLLRGYGECVALLPVRADGAAAADGMSLAAFRADQVAFTKHYLL